jgi:molybdenum cofactor cytidylyltransferase
MIAGIVLAAGGSTRMGRNKMLLPVPGGVVPSRAISALLEAGVDRVVVVLGADAELVRAKAAPRKDGRLRFAVNEEWRQGMSSSLRRGVEACFESDAVLIALADQPGMTPDRVRSVLAAFAPESNLVVPVHGGMPVHPILFARSLFPELLALTGDVGAREVVQRHWEEAIRIEMEPLSDIDTEEDYRSFLEAEGSPLTLPAPSTGGEGKRGQ